MEDAATIIATTDGYLPARDAMLSVFPKAVVHGEAARWASMSAEVEGGRLSFNSLAYTGPMDQFSRIWLPMSSKFDRVRTKNNRAKEKALGTLNQCLSQAKLMIGVTATPSFDLDPRFSGCLIAVAEAVSGLIFTGEALVEPGGRLVLGFDGQSEF